MHVRLASFAMVSAACVGLVAGCGSSEGPADPVAVATPSPAPTATPAPTAAPTPTPRPAPVLTGEEVYPGPVATVKVRLYAVMAPNGQFRPDPFYDPRTNNDVAYKDDFIVLDVTPRNAFGQKCEADTDPIWILENDAGILRRRPSSNPFLYRADTIGTGVVKVRAQVDRALSNLINIEIR